MKWPTDRATLKREWKFAKKYAFAWDFRIGLAVGVAVSVAALSDGRLRDTRHLLDVCVLLGIAILAVVIAAISIFAVFLTEDYGTVLRYKYREDVREAFYPYKLVALVSCLTTLVGALGLFLWPIVDSYLRESFAGLGLGLATWATLGTFDLVRITAGHGVLKLRLPELGEARLKQMEREARQAPSITPEETGTGNRE